MGQDSYGHGHAGSVTDADPGTAGRHQTPQPEPLGRSDSGCWHRAQAAGAGSISAGAAHRAGIRDGKLLEAVGPGVYGYWRLNHSMETRLFDLRTQTIEVSGQEILTKDRVSIRINLTANLRVTDAIQAAQQVEKLSDYLYKAMQLALREAVGTRELDELL